MGGNDRRGCRPSGGGTAFAGETTIAGLAAILSALAAGFITTHKPGERIASHAHAARNYYGLAEEIKLFVKFDWTRDETGRAPRESHDLTASGETSERRAEEPQLNALVGFMRREDDLNSQSPAVPVRLCKKAEEWISANEQWYLRVFQRTGKNENLSGRPLTTSGAAGRG